MKSFDYYDGDDLVEPRSPVFIREVKPIRSKFPTITEVEEYLNDMVLREEIVSTYRKLKSEYDFLKNYRMHEFWDDAKKEIISQRFSMILSEEVWEMMAENACSESGHLGTGAIYQSLVKYAAMIHAALLRTQQQQFF